MPDDPESKGARKPPPHREGRPGAHRCEPAAPASRPLAELADACLTWCDQVNSRRHRGRPVRIPASRLDIERTTLHVLPDEPLALALGEERTVAETARSASARSATRPRPATPVRGCGAGWWARSCLSPPAPTLVICRRFGATSFPPRVFRRSSTSTTPTIPTAAASTSRGCSPARKRRSRSWASAPGPGAGSRKPDPPAPPASAPRWPARSSWPPSWATTTSTRPWAWRPRPGASPTTICSRSWGHLADSKPAGEVVRADEAHSVQNGTSGWQALLPTQRASHQQILTERHPRERHLHVLSPPARAPRGTRQTHAPHAPALHAQSGPGRAGHRPRSTLGPRRRCCGC